MYKFKIQKLLLTKQAVSMGITIRLIKLVLNDTIQSQTGADGVDANQSQSSDITTTQSAVSEGNNINQSQSSSFTVVQGQTAN